MSKRAPISKLTHLKLGQGNPEPSDELITDEKIATTPESSTSVETEKVVIEEKIEVAAENLHESKDDWSVPDHSSKMFTKKLAEKEVEPTPSSNKMNLPKFLEENKILQSVTNSLEGEIKMLPFNGDTNPNSIGSIFSKDHEEITGIRRVFRKSLIFLVLHLFSFLLLTWAGLNILTFNPLIILVTFVLFVSITNLFYIIVADRSYVSLSLVGIGIGLLLIYSFLGQAFNIVSLAGVSIIILLAYIAYSEIEKIQLGSRLFTISNIVGSSTRILIGAAILILSLGLFNQMVSEKSSNFLNRTLFSNDTFVSKLIVGEGSPISLNRLVMNGASLYSTLETNTVKTTFKDFLSVNYKRGEDVVSKSEEPEIIISCENLSGGGKCANAVLEERNSRLENYRLEAYKKLPYTLDTVLDKDNFREISKQYYSNIVSEFETGSDIILPRAYLFPGISAAVLYLVLSLLSPLFSVLIQMLTWLGWQFMKATGFAKIEVETVESEVVSI
jgi:hypothetical protein